MYVCLPLFSDAVFVSLSSNKRGTWDRERGIKIKKKKATERAVTMPSSSEACLLFEYFKKNIADVSALFVDHKVTPWAFTITWIVTLPTVSREKTP